MKVEVAESVERPVDAVFRWYADDHVQNHPRWDPDMELEKVSTGPIRVGTVIRRRNTHFETPIEGTMDVFEYVPQRSLRRRHSSWSSGDPLSGDVSPGRAVWNHDVYQLLVPWVV